VHRERGTLIVPCGRRVADATCLRHVAVKARGIADLFDAFRKGLVMLPGSRIGT